MIHALGDFALQNLFQFLEVEDHAGCRVGFARHSDFQRVVVSVAMRVIALAKDPLVLLRAHGRVVVQMGCGKLNFSRQVDHVFAIASMPHSMLGGYLQDTLSLSMPESLFGERVGGPEYHGVQQFTGEAIPGKALREVVGGQFLAVEPVPNC